MTTPLSIKPLATFADLIRERRSIRRYRPEPLPRDLVEQLIDGARHAPSAHNRQPWRFAILDKLEDKERLAIAMGERLRADRAADNDDPEAIERDVTTSHARLVASPAIVAACATLTDMDTYPDARRAEAEHLMAVQSTAMAVQNLLLLAHAEGIGACWMCAPLFCPDTVKAALDLPTDWEPQALVTLGYPATPGRRRELRPLNEIVR